MLHIQVNAEQQVLAVSSEFPANEPGVWARKADGTYGAGWLNRNDITDSIHAAVLAEGATKVTGELHVGTDAGEGCYPRYDVVRAPKVGDVVSKGFNGDYYPQGTITKVAGEQNRIVTVTKENGAQVRFYRRKQTGAWVQAGGTWSLVFGTHSELNPHF